MDRPTDPPWSWSYADPECTRPIALTGYRDGKPVDVLTASEDREGPRAYVSEADEVLIELAPELLAVCREMLAEMMVWEQEHGQHPAAIKARALIARVDSGAIGT